MVIEIVGDIVDVDDFWVFVFDIGVEIDGGCDRW